MITNAPTLTPIIRLGALATNQAARGAATMPPTSSASTSFHGMLEEPRPIRNPILADIEITNSEVFAVPIAFRGSSESEAVKTVVTIGPQPPPPVASTNPPKRPRGANILARARR